jgi:hypothetical protein
MNHSEVLFVEDDAGLSGNSKWKFRLKPMIIDERLRQSHWLAAPWRA